MYVVPFLLLIQNPTINIHTITNIMKRMTDAITEDTVYNNCIILAVLSGVAVVIGVCSVEVAIQYRFTVPYKKTVYIPRSIDTVGDV